MTLVKDFQKCPFCRETIAAGAIRCKHCHADLTTAKKKSTFWSRFNNFRIGFLAGVLFTVIIFILGYLQFFSEP